MTEPLFKAALIELSNDEYFVEKLCVSHSVSVGTIHGLFKQFYDFKDLAGEIKEYRDTLEVRKNFIMWIPSQLRRNREQQNKDKGNGNNQTGNKQPLWRR